MNTKSKREMAALRNLPPDEAAKALVSRKLRISAENSERMKGLGRANAPRARAALMKRTDARWDSMTRANDAERVVLRQCLRAYDRDPKGFRAWLVRMLGQEAQAAE